VYAGTSPEMARAALAAARADRPAPWAVEEPAEAVDLASLSTRVAEVSGAWAAAADYYDREVAPIERVLRRYGAEQEMSRRIAVALVREANAVDLEPRLLLAVLLVENPWLDPEIRSSVGAIGLMQIMPVHQGGWSMCGPDLEDVEDNICYGANIFAHYFRGSGGDVDVALLRYNGCVTGANTPNCHQYPNTVFARAGRASVLAWLDQGPVAASP
jgi:soluble lytic murein transglycosylase-like protein